MENTSKLLEEIGLTEGETRVYLSLLKLGTTKTGPLALEASVSSSKVYKILDRLQKKGLAGHVIKGKVKYFEAMPPKTILSYMEENEKKIEEKKQQIKKMLPQLENLSLEKETSEAIVYSGFKAVTNLFKNILEELKSGEEYFVLGATYGEVPGLRDFFYNYHMQRASKNIKLNMLANHDTKNNVEPTTKKKAEIKFLPAHFISNMEIVFYKNKALLVLWTKTPTAFLVENKEAVTGFKAYFEALWKIARK